MKINPNDKLDSLSDQHIQACSTSPKLTKLEQTSPIHIEDWTKQQQQSSTTMITPPPTMTTTSSCDTINCSCCDYDGQLYPSSSYNSHYYTSSQQQTPSPHMTVNVPVVANFQVNVNTAHSAYPLANSNNHHHHYNLSRKQNMYYQQQQQPSSSSYYRTGYPTAMKYNQQQQQSTSIYPQQQYSSSSQSYMENNSHFPISSPYHHDFVYGHRQHHSIPYNSLNVNHQTNGHIYHQL